MSVRFAPAPPLPSKKGILMAIVYCIENVKNGKKYVGVTTKTLKERWKIHCSDMKRKEAKERKLYSDMNRYGKDAFEIKELEETSDETRFGREKYWVGKLDTFKNGYNETCGGDGKMVTDESEDLLYASEYIEGMTVHEIAKRHNKDFLTIKNSLARSKIEIKSGQEFSVEKFGIKVDMLDMNGNYIMTFPSISSASAYLTSNGMLRGGAMYAWSHIKDACEGRNYRKSVAKHRWRYAEK